MKIGKKRIYPVLQLDGSFKDIQMKIISILSILFHYKEQFSICLLFIVFIQVKIKLFIV